MRAPARRAVAVLDMGLAALLMVAGTLGVASSALLGWVWVALGFLFTLLAYAWLKESRAIPL